MKTSNSVNTLIHQGRVKKQLNWIPTVLIGVSIVYISLIIYIPAINVFYQAFHKGIEPFLSNFSEPDFLNAVKVRYSSH